jgi:hypothetical protein
MMLARETSLQGIADCARLRIDRLRLALSLIRAALPCLNTYRYVSDHIDLGESNEKLAGFLRAIEWKSSRGAETEADANHTKPA